MPAYPLCKPRRRYAIRLDEVRDLNLQVEDIQSYSAAARKLKPTGQHALQDKTRILASAEECLCLVAELRGVLQKLKRRDNSR